MKNVLIHIDNKKPVLGQFILYVGNLGLVKGTYAGMSNGGCGLVQLPDGRQDIFEEWKAF